MDNPFGFLSAQRPQSKFQLHHHNVKEMLRKLRQSANDKCPFYDYQVDAVLKASAMLIRDESELMDREDASTLPALIVAPTGAGKSGIILLLPYCIASSKVLIITPSKVISEQLAVAFGCYPDKKSFLEEIEVFGTTWQDRNRLRDLLESVKVINGPGDFQENLPNVVIVNAQKFGGRSRMSLMYRNEEIIQNVEAFFAQFDTLIVDEAHHYPATTWVRIVEEFGRPVSGMFKKMVFLTATPFKRINGKKDQFILGEENEHRVAYEVTQAMVEGISTRPYKFVERRSAPSHQNVFQDIMEIFNREPEDRFVSQAMVLVRTKNEADTMVRFLNEETNDSHFAVAALANRQPGLEEFTQGQYRVAVTCGLAKEGYNNKNVTLCVIYRNLRSKVLFTQFVGRCVRMKRGLEGPVPDRTRATILSYRKFDQRKLWRERERLATMDPDDDEVGDDDYY